MLLHEVRRAYNGAVAIELVRGVVLALVFVTLMFRFPLQLLACMP